MKGADWEFKKFLPDKEDIDAQCKSLEEYMLAMQKVVHSMNDGEQKVSAFCAGFNRGASWMRDKLMPHIKELIRNLERSESPTCVYDDVGDS